MSYRAFLQPGALPPVPVKCESDRFDNFIREFTVKELQQRNDLAKEDKA